MFHLYYTNMSLEIKTLPLSFCGEEVQNIVNKKKHEITTGRFNIFKGPLTDRDGIVKVAAGDVPTDTDLLSMDYFVRGVDGNL